MFFRPRQVQRVGLRFVPRAMVMLVLGLGLTGCASSASERQAQQAVSAYYTGDYETAIELLRPLSQEPDRNYVLNNLRLGEAALTAGDLETAERAYFRAYETLNAAGVNNAARSAATVLFDEEVRIWLGEPYERAIANFQLGLVYYLRGDYANARGAFENALFKLRRYADEEDAESDYQEQESTFAVAYLMLGRCWQRLGREDLAEDAFATAKELDPSLAQVADPQINARSNVLLVVAWGRGPEKVAQGSGVMFAAPGGRFLPTPRVTVDGQSTVLADLAVPAIDTAVMAQQRRWQTVDTFRAIKEVTGVGMMYGGVVVLDQGIRRDSGDAAAAGVAMIALGALLNATSSPDTRQWEMVPRTYYIVPLDLSPGTHDITVSLPDAFGYGEIRHTFRNVPVYADEETALYARMIGGQDAVVDFAPPPMEIATDDQP